MRVLIIGGTGLISTAITRQFVERGDDVTLFHRGQAEDRTGVSVPVIHGDRKDYPAFEARMAEAGTFDCVIDMVGFVPDDARSAIRAFRGRIGHLVFCSTVDVYNKPPLFLPYTEDHPRDARSEYGRNKATMEDLFFQAATDGAFNVTVIRPASTYGEGQTLIHTFGWTTSYFDRMRRGKPIIVHGDGSALWVACHIDDVARAFVNAACHPAAFGHSYHTAGEEWLTWNRYYETICEAMGWPAPTLVHMPTDLLVRLAPERTGVLEANFQFSNVFDNARARRDLGFRYIIPFRDGARRTMSWLQERGRIENCETDPFMDRLVTVWQESGERMMKDLSLSGI